MGDRMDYNINFPHLHLFFDHVGKNIMVGNFSIAYYGIIITLGMFAGISIAAWMARRTGQDEDIYYDMAFVAIICSVIGARTYYVIFQWDQYKDDLLSILNIRQGGLAIYGAVIAAIITVFIYTKIKKLSFGLISDTAVIGLVLGQAIGRWGNFFNREVFGGYTDNFLAMQLPVSAVRESDLTEELLENEIFADGVRYIQVHPTFLYESLWNLALLFFLIRYTNHKKFDGEVLLMYLIGYGVGRFWIEAIRTDQLYIPGTVCPVSMVLAAFLVVLATGWIVLWHVRNRRTGRSSQAE